MGKPTGFMEFERGQPAKRPASERTGDYREYVGRFESSDLNHQAARCMDCGVPFCHQGCPLGNVIPEFNDAVYQERWEEAFSILDSTNNFPEFTGRICPAPCESACVLGITNPPVAIEEIEKHIAEIAFEKGLIRARPPLIRSGKKVAVVGSGPAGLAAAAQLNYAGHTVTVFEKDRQPGGLLRYGIPDFKLEKSIVERRIRILREEGIRFECGVEAGKDFPVSDLLREFHAVVLAGGASVPRDLPAPGRELEGIRYAMDFLREQNQVVSKEREQAGQPPARGKNVIVIGGGDTGSDCVGTANRQGAASVTQFELMPRPPETRTGSMPWPSYPMILKTTSSHEEGCLRHWAIATKAFLQDEHGKLRALQVVDLEWSASDSGMQFKEIPGTEREVPCELVLLAMGFLHGRREGLIDDLGIALDNRGNILASESDFQTSLTKVFSCGDMRRGQSLVVWAIAEGRECARSVDRWLSGSSLLPAREKARVQFEL